MRSGHPVLCEGKIGFGPLKRPARACTVSARKRRQCTNMIPSSVMITARLTYTTTMVAVRITASEVAADRGDRDCGSGE